MAHKHERSMSRRTAVQVLYACEMRNLSEKKSHEFSPEEMIREGELDVIEGKIDEYAQKLIHGVIDNKARIDELLKKSSKNWALDRMSLVDLNVIRVSTFEMLAVKDVPVSVSIDEAVELAKGFGGEQSHKFVNGILGGISKMINEDEQTIAS